MTLWNRTDCCGDRLSDVYVFVSGTDMSGRTLAQLAADPNVKLQRLASLGSDSGTLSFTGTTGRYVRVQLGGSNVPLSLAEVQVFGSR